MACRGRRILTAVGPEALRLRWQRTIVWLLLCSASPAAQEAVLARATSPWNVSLGEFPRSAAGDLAGDGGVGAPAPVYDRSGQTRRIEVADATGGPTWPAWTLIDPLHARDFEVALNRTYAATGPWIDVGLSLAEGQRAWCTARRRGWTARCCPAARSRRTCRATS
jgi:hypothetical protein